MQSKENAQVKLFTHPVIIEALFASESQFLKNSKSNQSSQLYLQSDCTSQTDIPIFVLITFSAASHLFHQNSILRQLNTFIYFWINNYLPTHGCNSDL